MPMPMPMLATDTSPEAAAIAAPLRIAFIGCGRLARTLARAWQRAGQPVACVASRTPAHAQALADALPGCVALSAAEAVARADLVLLTVPDDAIATTAAALPWRAGQAVVHCSGATEVSVLQPAADAGALIGGFHPLQIFSDPEQALALLRGCSVAIEAPPALDAQLRALAALLQMRPIALPPGARALYHGGASYAASFLLSMLDEAVQAWAGFGVSEADALQALLPLAEGTLKSARAKGLAGALAGPVSRGDAGVVARHLAAFGALGAEQRAFYAQMTERQLRLAEASGRLSAAQRAALERVLG
jgi:predicted short-subunit dehydrogenase-like oxidoreductase (DUF2520 family)